MKKILNRILSVMNHFYTAFCEVVKTEQYVFLIFMKLFNFQQWLMASYVALLILIVFITAASNIVNEYYSRMIHD